MPTPGPHPFAPREERSTSHLPSRQPPPASPGRLVQIPALSHAHRQGESIARSPPGGRGAYSILTGRYHCVGGRAGSNVVTRGFLWHNSHAHSALAEVTP